MKRVVADRINIEKVEKETPRKEITNAMVKTEEKQKAQEEPTKNENPNVIKDKKQRTPTPTLSPIKSNAGPDIAKPKSAAEAASSWLHSAKAEAMTSSSDSQAVLVSSVFSFMFDRRS